MGAFGSCLGVGRPTRPGTTDPRLLGSNLVDTSHFGPNAAGPHRPGLRPPPINPRNPYLPNGQQLKRAMPKLLRQSSSLSSNNNQQLPSYNFNSPSQNVQKLVDIDDSSSDKQNQSGHLASNIRKSQLNPSENGANPQILANFMQNMRMNPSENRVVIALYDYDSRTPEDLEFKKGEHLETTKSLMTSEWWLACSKTTKKVGYVPSNYVAELKSLGAEPWYLGGISRKEAEAHLMMPENKDGAFIIRDSEKTDQSSHFYSLSVRHEDGVKHYRIRQFEAGGFYIDRKTVFSTIHDLVLHYSKAPNGLCINLREPCVTRLIQPATAGLSYDTYDQWEMDRKKLRLLNELGRGQFGQVFEGLFNNQVRCAIKTLRKGSMDPKDFLEEAQIMKKMDHPNLVKLYAVCTKEEPVYIITELMSKGALISYLQTDEGKRLDLKEYIRMATQIAAGMSYLEREKYVHRDLAARNILVGEGNVCKIADFGLARFIKETEYEARAGARFPIKWTAPEAANFSKFTIKSDVWSFGIVLYEIITKGGTPYPDMTNAEVLNCIDKGYRMPQPPNCESKYYGYMVECWNKDPHKRPTFETLHWRLDAYFNSDEQYGDASRYRDK